MIESFFQLFCALFDSALFSHKSSHSLPSIKFGWVNHRGIWDVFTLNRLLQSDFLCKPLKWVSPLKLLQLFRRVLVEELIDADGPPTVKIVGTDDVIDAILIKIKSQALKQTRQLLLV